MESGEFMVRIIGKRSDGALLATNSINATINDIEQLGIIINSRGAYLSEELPIGTLTKFDIWESTDDILELNENSVKDSLIGFAVGDAFGVPFEFMRRDIIRANGVRKMIGNGSHSVPIGSWSDDTSMIVATMDAIINDDAINYNHIMDNYIAWLNGNEFTSIDYTFGVGNTVFKALNRYYNGTDPLKCGGTAIKDNGNGSLMRILPISLYCIVNNLDSNETKKIISEASSLTHAHDISKLSCYIYTEFLREILRTKNPEMSLEYIHSIDYSGFSDEAIEAHKKILSETFIDIDDTEIKQSGYVVDTLEAVLYSILNTYDFESAIICATEMGYDTDTIAGITGSLAGIIYGYESIPEEWTKNLKKYDYLEDLSIKYNKFLKKQDKNKVKCYNDSEV